MLNIFILCCFLGYFAIWNVSPALHAALMSMTNAISGIVILGAIDAFNEITDYHEPFFLYTAIFMASFNIFGGFFITIRMLNMFKPKGKTND
jgi:NAD(P) transhydrogenase subunit alpha